ncbi:MFS transporter [Mesorhizobium sp. SB112]|uniref:MFS transporter n=1 Tax=Mesorhizobium sp. SB112 TaxID=3151853 RepID=UPI003266AAFA
MDALNLRAAAVHGRWAVASLFFVNGFVTGSWAPQIPVVLKRLGISEFMLGMLILMFGLGALCAMAWCGYLLQRYGSRFVVASFAWVASFGLLMVALAPTLVLVAFAMFFFGGVIGGMDVAMNANAVAVEKKLSRAIMSSSHGFWSLGGFAGGGLGGIFIQTFGYVAHGAFVAIVALVIVAFAVRKLVGETPALVKSSRKFALASNPLIYLIGLMALFSMVPEGSVLDWAALYLQQERGTNLATAGFAFAAFSATMACMRFMGDGIRNRFGAVNTLRVSSLIAAAGMMVAGLSPWPWLAIFAFAFAGLGIANMVPIAFSAAGNQKGMSSGVALSTVTLMGYSGILVAPSAIGFIGQRTGFGPIFVAVAALLIVVFLMAGLAKAADFEHENLENH